MAYSCDCDTTLSIPSSYFKNDYVLKVTVVDVKLNHQLNQTKDFLDSLSKKDKKKYFAANFTNEYELIVTKSFKGQIKCDTIILRTALYPAVDCGLILEINKSYILYGNIVSPYTKFYQYDDKYLVLTSGICSRTALSTIKEENELLKLKK